ncbi:hypothetical protein PLCT2_02100 [Planctomycetaceae bacterium]|nr:hypothetical protein PLCT2_02100 [Planctomycetaceae bacterium]
MRQDVRPKWWQLYLALPLLIGLFMVDFRLNLSARGHQIAQLGILLFVYWLVHLWLKANEPALFKMDTSRQGAIISIIQFPLRDQNLNQPLLQLPKSEIKGVLGDTFEMDSTETEIFPMKEISQDYQKE